MLLKSSQLAEMNVSPLWPPSVFLSPLSEGGKGTTTMYSMEDETLRNKLGILQSAKKAEDGGHKTTGVKTEKPVKSLALRHNPLKD